MYGCFSIYQCLPKHRYWAWVLEIGMSLLHREKYYIWAVHYQEVSKASCSDQFYETGTSPHQL